jgi:hypothetical protein
MKPAQLLLITALLAAGIARGQKAWQGELTSLFTKIPIPKNSAACFAACTKDTDPNNGSVSIKDNGPQYTDLQNQLSSILMNGANGGSMPTSNAAPTPAQIEQMREQAMARATAAQAQAANPQQMTQSQQSYGGGAPSAGNVAIMKTIGQAQTAAAHINQLCGEVGQKMSKLSKDSVQAVKQGPNCPEVQQGGYAGPTCGCLVAHATTYYTARVAAMDNYVTQVAELIREYLPRIKSEASVIDDMEAKAKYGDAVSNPAFRQMAVSIQRQAFAGITSLLSYSQSAWNDGANEFANETNAKSGASVGCNKK